MVGADAREDVPLFRLAAPRVIEVNQAHGGVIRIRAGGRVEDAVEVPGASRAELRRKNPLRARWSC